VQVSSAKATVKVDDAVLRRVESALSSAQVPHTGMQLDGLGIRGELVNGLTRRTGNVSACSIPHALVATWGRLRGLVACPTAAVGSPGKPEVLQGCVLLRATTVHERQAAAAA
jgi:hypothetical protein